LGYSQGLLLYVDNSERIVLNQWAVGENVEKWNANMKKYLMEAQESRG
jgi:hypothetical protein